MNIWKNINVVLSAQALMLLCACAQSNNKAATKSAPLSLDQKMNLLYEGDTIQIFSEGKTPADEKLARCVHFSSTSDRTTGAAQCVVADPKPGTATGKSLPQAQTYVGKCVIEIQNIAGAQTFVLCFPGADGHCGAPTAPSQQAQGGGATVLASVSPVQLPQDVVFDLASATTRWQVNRFHICAKFFAPGSSIPASNPEFAAAANGTLPSAQTGGVPASTGAK